MEEERNKVLVFAENHPYVLLGALIILILIIIMMYIGDCGWNLPGISKKKRKKPLDNEDEMDELIKSIHSKQRSKKC